MMQKKIFDVLKTIYINFCVKKFNKFVIFWRVFCYPILRENDKKNSPKLSKIMGM